MSTITVSLRGETAAASLGVDWRPGTSVKQAYHEMLIGFVTFADLAIAASFQIPVLTVWAIVLGLMGFLGWRLFARVKRMLSRVRVPAN